jgi:hypothetical protein
LQFSKVTLKSYYNAGIAMECKDYLMCTIFVVTVDKHKLKTMKGRYRYYATNPHIKIFIPSTHSGQLQLLYITLTSATVPGDSIKCSEVGN